MTKTLTEQWREGTLPEGFYYMKDYAGGYNYRYLLGVKPDADFVKFFKEVLSPVPSYDEHNELKQDNKYLKLGIETRDKQIEQLVKRLEIATKALKEYDNKLNWDIRGVSFMKYNKGFTIARKALKEMEGVK